MQSLIKIEGGFSKSYEKAARSAKRRMEYNLKLAQLRNAKKKRR